MFMTTSESCEVSQRQEQSVKVNAFLYIVTPVPTASVISQANACRPTRRGLVLCSLFVTLAEHVRR